MRRLIVTLLTATMMLPTGAVAQDRGDRRPRAEGGPAMGEARQRPWRDQMQPVGGAPDDARRRFDRAPDRAQDRGSDRPRVEQRAEPRAEPRPDRNGADWSRGGVDTGARYGIPARDDRRDDRPRDDDGRGRWDDRRDDGRGRWNDRRDGDRSGWNDRYRRDDRRTGNTWSSDRDDGNRGGWNRGWRGDSRYDWTRYRTVNRNAYRLPRYYAPSGWGGGYRRFGIGTRLSSGLWGQNYWLDDPFAYRLPEAYGPYRWVRYYGDALLVDLRTGLVVDSVYDIFW
jgi:hypothetical protein